MQAAQLGGGKAEAGGTRKSREGEGRERGSQNQCQSQRNERLRIESREPSLNQGLVPTLLRNEWTDS